MPVISKFIRQTKGLLSNHKIPVLVASTQRLPRGDTRSFIWSDCTLHVYEAVAQKIKTKNTVTIQGFKQVTKPHAFSLNRKASIKRQLDPKSSWFFLQRPTSLTCTLRVGFIDPSNTFHEVLVGTSVAPTSAEMFVHSVLG